MTTTEHKHLCKQCKRQFTCQGTECEEFEIQLCPDCQSNPEPTERGKRRRRSQRGSRRRLTTGQRIERQVMVRRARMARQARRRAMFYGVNNEYVSYDEIRLRDGNKCYLCGEFLSVHDETFDHVVPLVKGGEHIASNIRLAHRSCNSRKGKSLR